MARGKYIVIESGEGGGKTTQAEMLYNFLKEKNIPCYLGREPGGIGSAEAMRTILKHNAENISPIAEVFGFEFARAEFFDKIVFPKLREGVNIISDRSGYSTIAYQGYGSGLDIYWIKSMNEMAMKGLKPDIAFIIDIDPIVGLEREIVKDRFSGKGLEYHKKVRQGFLDIAESEPERCIIINYIPNGREKMQEQIREHISKFLNIN
jgi:dTMP kinase